MSTKSELRAKVDAGYKDRLSEYFPAQGQITQVTEGLIIALVRTLDDLPQDEARILQGAILTRSTTLRIRTDGQTIDAENIAAETE